MNTNGADRRIIALAQILMDLDRCEHGRHSRDQCFGCPSGQSAGNPFLKPGQQIGYFLDGHPIVVPEHERRYEPAAWRPVKADSGD